MLLSIHSTYAMEGFGEAGCPLGASPKFPFPVRQGGKKKTWRVCDPPNLLVGGCVNRVNSHLARRRFAFARLPTSCRDRSAAPRALLRPGRPRRLLPRSFHAPAAVDRRPDPASGSAAAPAYRARQPRAARPAAP